MDPALNAVSSPGAQRVEAWERSVRRRLGGVQVTVRPDPGFQGALSGYDLSYLRILSIRADAMRLSRTAHLVTSVPDDHVLLALQVAGVSALRQDGRDAVLRAGDLAVCDLRRPFSFEQRRRFHLHLLRVPERALGHSGHLTDRLTGRAVPARAGVAALLAPFASALAAQAERTTRPVADRLAGTFADMLATLVDERALATRPDSGDARQDLVRRIRRYIDAHLRDPDLSPAAIADAHRISVRYLHLLFEDQETTVYRLVLRRRVEECLRDIARRGPATTTVSAVVRAWGFRDTAQFSRSFKAVHGYAFRDWRAGRREGRELLCATSSG
ncbi:helix-turn-helix domain-containing protein [Streptomyces sp. CC219B]|uniref:AraC-like ligand-binding domain-containing protein n=1 Tax=Streptomyces sp. CC219B TaxID=3044574 RepID=UPI0024A9979C|nr:helix-turn-helix domain-containing protein [Streptomyces sp. CC219B]